METLNTLTINCGSSSLKASLFLADGQRINYCYRQTPDQKHGNYHAKAFEQLLDDLKISLRIDAKSSKRQTLLIGHRFVHGGDIAEAARLIDANERSRLESITHLAPLHMPSNLQGVDICTQAFAHQFKLIQVACFDTAFHHTLSELAYRLPIPKALDYRRYGFHGLNYANIAQQLTQHLGATANGHIVIAHLGNGASLCLIKNLRSIDTSMGYSPAGGIPMATRSGDIDPGVMLELAKDHDYHALSELVYQKMGLLALSNGESSDMSALIESNSAHAKFAIAFFTRQVRATIGAYAAKVGGLDAIVFTGGIGEHSALVRAMICDHLEFMGFKLNIEKNQQHATVLSNMDSKPILMIPADEEAEIARLAYSFSHL
ncbi:acetate/propionate family kinase [Methylotenera mobilis]|uniref:acetate/propionate family kinase n=1 Tax=Methylotenera mobilis TaxID=359408 RepID=UPI000382A964|nr:hypothetical protein [Methylotenera mobilis]PPC96432.1 MAG: acetate kinase [Methylotenera sp.]